MNSANNEKIDHKDMAELMEIDIIQIEIIIIIDGKQSFGRSVFT